MTTNIQQDRWIIPVSVEGRWAGLNALKRELMARVGDQIGEVRLAKPCWEDSERKCARIEVYSEMDACMVRVICGY